MKRSRGGKHGNVQRITRRAFVATLVGLGGLWAAESIGRAVARWDSAASTPATATTFPSWVRRTPASLQAYQVAYASLDLIDTLPCFCGCDRMVRSHASLKDCFVQPDGRIEQHASVCGTCQGEAIDAARWSQEGVPWPQIYDRIVAAYSNGMPVPQRQRPT